jgi:hypothetical protein
MTQTPVQHSFNFRWPQIKAIRSDSFQTRFERALGSTNWVELLHVARCTRSSECEWQEEVGFGGSHLVRIVTFIDGMQWLARVNIPKVRDEFGKEFQMMWTADDVNWMQSEIDTMQYIRMHSEIAIPEVFTYDVTTDNAVGMPYMFLEVIYGNSIRDLGVDIPSKYREKVFANIARVHVPFF